MLNLQCHGHTISRTRSHPGKCYGANAQRASSTERILKMRKKLQRVIMITQILTHFWDKEGSVSPEKKQPKLSRTKASKRNWGGKISPPSTIKPTTWYTTQKVGRDFEKNTCECIIFTVPKTWMRNIRSLLPTLQLPCSPYRSNFRFGYPPI